MLVPMDVVVAASEEEGLRAEEPDENGFFCFSYGVDEVIFVQAPDPDGMVDLDFTLEQVAFWDTMLAERLRRRIVSEL